MSSSFTVASVFNQIFLSSVAIQFNSSWANGTGYYDYAVRGEHAPSLKEGEVVCSASPMPNNRKIVIVGTRFGNVVIFERYTNAENDVFVSNMPEAVRQIFTGLLDNRITYDQMESLVGTHCMRNVGQRIEDMFEATPVTKGEVMEMSM